MSTCHGEYLNGADIAVIALSSRHIRFDQFLLTISFQNVMLFGGWTVPVIADTVLEPQELRIIYAVSTCDGEYCLSFFLIYLHKSMLL